MKKGILILAVFLAIFQMQSCSLRTYDVSCSGVQPEKHYKHINARKECKKATYKKPTFKKQK